MTRRPPFAPGTTLTVQDVADLIDHALLKPELTPDEVAGSVRELAGQRIWSVCVRPSAVSDSIAARTRVSRSAARPRAGSRSSSPATGSMASR